MRRVAAGTLGMLMTVGVLALGVPAGATEVAGPHPFVAYVSLHDRGWVQCGGALVHPSWVLTSARCFTHYHGYPERRWHRHGAEAVANVTIGESRLFDGTRDGEDRGVSEVLFHPGFAMETDPYTPFDLALLRLSSPSTKRPIEIASPASPGDQASWMPEDAVGLVGYGGSDCCIGPPTPDVRKIPLLVEADASAEERIDGRGSLFADFDGGIHLSAKRRPGATCPSDGWGPLEFHPGSPLVADTTSGPKLAGVATWWGASCDGGVFSRVGGPRMHHWLRSATAETPLVGDVNGDGRDDIVTFTHGTARDVWVALSTGTTFGASSRWHEAFANTGDRVALGDLDGDRRLDIWSFSDGAVSFALSEGTRFSGVVYSQTISMAGTTPIVGDFSGDGRDDLVLAGESGFRWYRSEGAGLRYVSGEVEIGSGGGFRGSAMLADATGDGREDLVLFTQGTNGSRVFVRPSTGTAFGAGTEWHSWFAPAGEMPGVGRMDRDARADIATFTREPSRDVWVASAGAAAFGASTVWHSSFGRQASRLAVGDVNGDGLADIVEFTQKAGADVYVSLNTGLRTFGAAALWHGYFAP